MPYEIVMQSGKHVVRHKGGGRVFGRHASHAAAVKQLRALYVHAPPEGEKKKVWRKRP